MVKIRRRVSSKRYFSKACHEYERFFIELQKHFHDTLKPFLEKDLKMNVIEKGKQADHQAIVEEAPVKHS